MQSFLAFQMTHIAVCQMSLNPFLTFLSDAKSSQQAQWINKFGGMMNVPWTHPTMQKHEFPFRRPLHLTHNSTKHLAVPHSYGRDQS